MPDDELEPVDVIVTVDRLVVDEVQKLGHILTVDEMRHIVDDEVVVELDVILDALLRLDDSDEDEYLSLDILYYADMI